MGQGKLIMYIYSQKGVWPTKAAHYILVIARSQICLMPYMVVLCDDQFGQELFS